MKSPPLSPLERKPTVVDVARAADVAVGTVSRVLNMPELVGPEVRQRVLDAVAHLNYRPLRRRRRPGKRGVAGERGNIGVLVFGAEAELDASDRAALAALTEAATGGVDENILHAQLGRAAEPPVFLSRHLADVVLLCAPRGAVWRDLASVPLREMLARLPAVWLGHKPDGAVGDLIAAARLYPEPGHIGPEQASAPVDANAAAALETAMLGRRALDLLHWRLAHLEEPVNLTWLIEPHTNAREAVARQPVA